jgi:hypothetical protein
VVSIAAMAVCSVPAFTSFCFASNSLKKNKCIAREFRVWSSSSSFSCGRELLLLHHTVERRVYRGN